MRPARSLSVLIILSLCSYSLPARSARADQATDPRAGALSAASDIIPPASASANADWHTECVDCPNWISNLSNRSLALDSTGHPHLVYGGDRLFHAWHDGLAWHTETVNLSNCSSATIALDSLDRPHIAYYDALTSALQYAF